MIPLKNFVLFILLLNAYSVVISKKLHVFQEKAKKDPSLISFSRADKVAVHEVIFAISQSNMKQLIQVLEDVSDPSSSNYGKHWSKSQVAEFTANKKSYNAVMGYLNSTKNVVINRQSLYGEYIFAKAPVHVWEDVFATTFHTYQISVHNEKRKGKLNKIIRAEEYSLPVELDGHVSTVLNTVQFHYKNIVSKKRYKNDENAPPLSDSQQQQQQQKESPEISTLARPRAQPVYSPTIKPSVTRAPYPTAQPSGVYSFGSVTPRFINQYYNVSNSTGNLLVSQAVYETDDEGYSPSDLTMFQQIFGLPQQAAETNQYGDFSEFCPTGGCYEGNLDVQYIMGIAPNVNTTYDYSPTDQYDFLSNWITSVSNTSTPANVYSISWGEDELYVSSSFADVFNTEAIKLGVMGTTILASSGDDGALSSQARGDAAYCGYGPSFPASSPYVVAVGATNVSMQSLFIR